ncbi:MAG TPA: Wzz/FepE/Etk N-terminal domain-containing protein [Trebonia sp.]|nr:Wzz/FepE/Etk N-terminal domain-containing protein [Trebonia sp.]
MNDPDKAVSWPAGMEDDLPEHLWAPLGLTLDEEPVRPSPTGGLVSLAFIREALGRAKWVWCATTVLGLVIGCGLYVRYPPAYHAQTTVLVADAQGADPEVQVLTDQSVAQSQPVAANVVQQLGLAQSAASFQTQYSVTVVTPSVLAFNVGAPTSAEAVQRAAAVASSFLQYRAKFERTQLQQQAAVLQQQYNSAYQSLQQIENQLGQLPAANPTSAQLTQQTKLQAQAGDERQIMQVATSTMATNAAATESLISGSYVLNPATQASGSKAKGAALYVLGGIFGGLVVGMAIVIISALLSDRLRRRDDVAAALGAPVRLSVASLGLPRRGLLPHPQRKARWDRDMKRVTAYLQGAVSGSHHGPASLAVVAVDDPEAVAPAVAALARSRAKEGKQVVVADLSAGRPLARLLGVKAPGVHPVTLDGVPLLVAVPNGDDIAPVGPLRGDDVPAVLTPPDEAVVAACSSADLLVTLVTLDPATGGEHLATWASEAIAVVTAGRSSAEKVHSAGELIRLAGTRFNSAILLGADRTDASLGLLDLPRPADGGAAEREPGDRERRGDAVPDGGSDLGDLLP